MVTNYENFFNMSELAHNLMSDLNFSDAEKI